MTNRKKKGLTQNKICFSPF